MKRFLAVAGVFAFFSLQLVFSDTVVVYMENENTDNLWDNEKITLVRALENGITDSFFEAGHILINTNIDGRGSPFPGIERAFLLAKANGASYLLKVGLFFGSTNGDISAEVLYAEYELFEVVTEKMVGKGEIYAESLEGVKKSDSEEVSFSLGKALGRNAMKQW
ncbi:MAG: hypothetical protein DRP87_02925 [Spirochaetes bacterium]|nr:MAG: hypothetical protein DRP87_02925 [Spirochaetota bacterium]